MKAAIVVFALVVSAFAVINPIYKEWDMWKKTYQPHYASNDEHDRRFEIFSINKRIVLELNKKYANVPNGPRFALGKFADLSAEEFASMYLDPVPAARSRFELLAKNAVGDYPSRLDYRELGAVNPCVDQGQCSCWPFSAIGNMEGVWKVAHGDLPKLSVQQLLDCDHDCSIYHGQQRCDDGCVGGLMSNAMNYAVREGMMSADDYPQTGATGTCKYDKSKATYRYKKWFTVGTNDDDLIAALNEEGPLSVAVDATQWQFYTGGIFSKECGKTLNHGVLLVGYDSTTGANGEQIDYWIVKNSWGGMWGENGYIRVIRHQDECGINDFVNTVVA